MIIDLSEWTSRLEKLAHRKATKERRAQVEEALRSKWEGIQVCGSRVLAAWGDSQSVDRLQSWLELNEDKDAGWAVRTEAIRGLCKCYRPEDVDWLLDKYFSARDARRRYELFPVINALPEKQVRTRIATEFTSNDPWLRESAQFAMNRLESDKQGHAATRS